MKKSRAKIHFCKNCQGQYLGVLNFVTNYCANCYIAECVCRGCKKTFSIRRKDLDDGRGKYCTFICYKKNTKNVWQSGSKHPMWKGGVSFAHGYRSSYGTEYKKRKLKAGGVFTSKDWLEIKMKFGFMCLCCKKVEPEVKLEADHIIPLSLGGRNEPENIQPLCRVCNARKNVKVINYILEYENS